MLVGADGHRNSTPAKLFQHIHDSVIWFCLMEQMLGIEVLVLCHKRVYKSCILCVFFWKNLLDQFAGTIAHEIAICCYFMLWKSMCMKCSVCTVCQIVQ